MSPVQMKGQALRQYLSVIEHFYGAAMLERIIARTDVPEFRALWEKKALLPSSWYPITWSGALLHAALKELPQETDLPERVGAESARRNMQGIYAFLTRLVSPEFCIRQAPRVWGTYNRGTTLHSEILGPELARIRFSNGRGIDRVLWRAMLSGASQIFARAGAKQVQTSILAGGREADEETLVEVRWKS